MPVDPQVKQAHEQTSGSSAATGRRQLSRWHLDRRRRRAEESGRGRVRIEQAEQ
jgi:hypothetical protein